MWPRLYFLKILVNLCQYYGRVGLSNSKNILNRFKFNDFISSNYRNKTNIAWSLLFAFKILLFLSHSVSYFFVKVVFLKQWAVHCFDFVFFSLLIQFICFHSLSVSVSGDVEVNCDLTVNQLKLFQSAAGTLTAFLLMALFSCIL